MNLGIEYVKLFNLEYSRRNRNKKYLPRLLYLSNLAAFYNNCKTVIFIPSFSVKDKHSYTVTSRRFIGILGINGIEYLTYYITKEHNKKYINSVIYDIQKEKKYKNIIIFINDITRIDINDFAFGMYQVLIIEDTKVNKEKLKYLHSINWLKVISKNYIEDIYIAEYKFCDYTDCKSKYISTFYFLDSEKINRIKYFLRENKNKNADIVCNTELSQKLKKELPTANYIIVNLEEYIDKEQTIYD